MTKPITDERLAEIEAQAAQDMDYNYADTRLLIVDYLALRERQKRTEAALQLANTAADLLKSQQAELIRQLVLAESELADIRPKYAQAKADALGLHYYQEALALAEKVVEMARPLAAPYKPSSASARLDLWDALTAYDKGAKT